MDKLTESKIWVFNIERFAVHDGPGIRTCVFLQGCPLRCQWCANPESQTRGVHLMHLDSKCSGCGRCVPACPQQAISLQEGKAVFRREKCIKCGTCVKACLQGANQLCGKQMSLLEIYETVMRDIDYYRTSGGGVTFSGGEAVGYAKELLPLMKKLKEAEASVAVETCGQVAWEQLELLLPYVDVFLYDIKSLDGEVLRTYTKGDACRIQDNLENLAKQDASEIILRVPVIPGVNFSREALEDIFIYGKELGISKIDLLPYHTLGITKYEQLGMEYPFARRKSLQEKELEDIKLIGEKLGLSITIGGTRT